MDSEQVVKLRERLLQCAVCMDEYKDPRILPCHHTMCLECIESVLQSSSSNGRFFRCPQCRADITVPRAGAMELPINFYIISLQDELGIKEYTGKCDVCERDSITAVFRCVDCDIDICKFCIHAHRLKTHTEPPKILRIESSATNIPARFCTSHVDENCLLFCLTCNEAICVTCSCTSHKPHKTVPISVQFQETRKNLQAELDRLITEKRNAAKAGEEVEKLKQEVVDCHTQSVERLTVAASEACRFITERTEALEDIIRSSAEAQEEHIKEAMRDYKSYVQLIEKGVGFLQDLQTNDVCLEVVDAYKEFVLQLDAAKKRFTSKRFCLQMYDFSPLNTTKVFSVNLLKKHFYHFGKLGTLSKNKSSITINQKTIQPIRQYQGLSSVAKKRLSRVITYAFVIFVLLPIILYITDTNGSLKKTVSTCWGQLFSSACWAEIVNSLFE